MTTSPSFEAVLNQIGESDRRTADLVHGALHEWFGKNAPEVEDLVVFETSKGTGVQTLRTSSGRAIDLKQLENLNQLNDLVFFYASHIVDEYDYDWDDDDQRVWTVSVGNFTTADGPAS